MPGLKQRMLKTFKLCLRRGRQQDVRVQVVGQGLMCWLCRKVEWGCCISVVKQEHRVSTWGLLCAPALGRTSAQT